MKKKEFLWSETVKQYRLIDDWQNKKLTCDICGRKKSVKYETDCYDITNDKWEKLCLCNRCILC